MALETNTEGEDLTEEEVIQSVGHTGDLGCIACARIFFRFPIRLN